MFVSVSVSGYMHVTSCQCRGQKRTLDSPGTGILGACKPLDMDAGNQTQEPLRCLSSPRKTSDVWEETVGDPHSSVNLGKSQECYRMLYSSSSIWKWCQCEVYVRSLQKPGFDGCPGFVPTMLLLELESEDHEFRASRGYVVNIWKAKQKARKQTNKNFSFQKHYLLKFRFFDLFFL